MEKVITKSGPEPVSEQICLIIYGSALIDANQPIEVPENHHQSSGLLASLMVTLFTVWVYIIVVLTSLCPSNS
jgi:hypothetical protein